MSKKWVSALHGGGFAGSIVAKEGGDLPLVKLQVKVVYGYFPSLLVDFHQISDVHAEVHFIGFAFNLI